MKLVIFHKFLRLISYIFFIQIYFLKMLHANAFMYFTDKNLYLQVYDLWLFKLFVYHCMLISMLWNQNSINKISICSLAVLTVYFFKDPRGFINRKFFHLLGIIKPKMTSLSYFIHLTWSRFTLHLTISVRITASDGVLNLISRHDWRQKGN